MSLHAVTEPETAAIVRQTRHARTMRYRFMVISRLRSPGKRLGRAIARHGLVRPGMARPGNRVDREKRIAGAVQTQAHGSSRIASVDMVINAARRCLIPRTRRANAVYLPEYAPKDDHARVRRRTERTRAKLDNCPQ